MKKCETCGNEVKKLGNTNLWHCSVCELATSSFIEEDVEPKETLKTTQTKLTPGQKSHIEEALYGVEVVRVQLRKELNNLSPDMRVGLVVLDSIFIMLNAFYDKYKG